MKIDILVEEPSMKGFLEPVLPKIIFPPDTWSIHVLSCFKTKLEKRLRGFTHQDPGKYRIIIISDLDRKDCREMKQWLEDIVHRAGLHTKTNPHLDGSYSVITRLAIQELESWILGDFHAIHAVYSRVPETLGTHSKYKTPDNVGNTWESLHALLKKDGYCGDIYPKIEVARKVAPHIDPQMNQSQSFQIFLQGLNILLSSSSPST